jgi:predicted secreted Zn-dependent protease
MKEYDEEQRKRRMAKSFIEADRQLFASEAGYDTLLSIMLPRTATPKNDVLVGWPRQWAGVSAHAEDEVSGGHIIGFNNEIQNALMTMVAPDPPAVKNDSTIERPQKNMEKAIKLLEKQLFG